jgi:hypothetical protein
MQALRSLSESIDTLTAAPMAATVALGRPLTDDSQQAIWQRLGSER